MSESLVVHHLENSRSQRVLWLLEELGVPYELRKYARDPKTMRAPPALAEVHPLGKSPVISDQGSVVAESAAIIEYVLAHHGAGRLVPAAGSPERLRYTYFLHYAEGSLMPNLLLSFVFARVPRAKMPFFARPIAKAIAERVLAKVVAPELTRHLDFLEGELERSPWFAGNELSGADIQMSYPLEAAAGRGWLDASRPKLSAYLERIRGRPAYQRALAKGGPFEVLR